MQKIIDFFKRTFKGPINSPEDIAERKQDLKKIYIIAGIVFAISFILTVVGLGFMGIFSTLAVILAIAGLLVQLSLKGFEKKFEALTCEQCKKVTSIQSQEDFEKYISYSVKYAKLNMNVNTPRMLRDQQNPKRYESISLTGSVHIVSDVDITCAHCGAVKTTDNSSKVFEREAIVSNFVPADEFELSELISIMAIKLEGVLMEALDKNGLNTEGSPVHNAEVQLGYNLPSSKILEEIEKLKNLLEKGELDEDGKLRLSQLEMQLKKLEAAIGNLSCTNVKLLEDIINRMFLGNKALSIQGK